MLGEILGGVGWNLILQTQPIYPIAVSCSNNNYSVHASRREANFISCDKTTPPSGMFCTGSRVSVSQDASLLHFCHQCLLYVGKIKIKEEAEGCLSGFRAVIGPGNI